VTTFYAGNASAIHAIFRALEAESPGILRKLRDGAGDEQSIAMWASRYRLSSEPLRAFASRLWRWWKTHPKDAESLRRGFREVDAVDYPFSDEEKRVVLVEMLPYAAIVSAREWRTIADRAYRKLRRLRGPLKEATTLERDARWFVMHHVKGLTLSQIQAGEPGATSTIEKAIKNIRTAAGIEASRTSTYVNVTR